MLNTRTELPVTRPNVVDTMKFHAIDDEQFLGLIDDLEITRQTFYNTAIHFKTLRAIICNPSAYSQKLNMSNEDAQFKSEATVKNMKELFIKEAVTVRTPSATPQTKRNQRKILNDLEENSSHSEDSSSSSSDDDDADAAAIAVSNVRQTPARKLSAK